MTPDDDNDGRTSNSSLGHWSQAQGQPMHFNTGTGLSDDEANRYSAAIATFRAVTERNTFVLLQRHHHRLEATVAAFANLERLGGSFRNVDKRAVNITLMGEIVDWLAAGRLYTESTRDFMLRQFGHGAQLERFKSATSSAFDGFAGYRFMYNLRDYTQHCGPPLGGTTVGRVADGNRTFDLYLKPLRVGDGSLRVEQPRHRAPLELA